MSYRAQPRHAPPCLSARSLPEHNSPLISSLIVRIVRPNRTQMPPRSQIVFVGRHSRLVLPPAACPMRSSQILHRAMSSTAQTPTAATPARWGSQQVICMSADLHRLQCLLFTQHSASPLRPACSERSRRLSSAPRRHSPRRRARCASTRRPTRLSLLSSATPPAYLARSTRRWDYLLARGLLACLMLIDCAEQTAPHSPAVATVTRVL